jgi:hypothetical protein
LELFLHQKVLTAAVHFIVLKVGAVGKSVSVSVVSVEVADMCGHHVVNTQTFLSQEFLALRHAVISVQVFSGQNVVTGKAFACFRFQPSAVGFCV